MNETKQQLRIKYLKILKNLDLEQKKQWDKVIFQKFINSRYFQDYSVFALYISLSYEFNTIQVIKFLLANNKKIALPRMKDRTLEFYYIDSISDLVIDNQWGIYQPKQTERIAKIEDLDLIVVPLVAFNQSYYRIGHGQGYYDYFLSNSKLKALKLAFAYQMQLISDDVSFIDNWDISFDALITN